MLLISSFISISILVTVIHLFFIWAFKFQHIKSMFLSFIISGFFVALYILDFSFYDKGTIIFTWGFVCLGYMEAFSMLCRGFSLTLLVDIFLKPEINIQELMEGYGGKGANWLFQKRLNGLENLNLIRVQSNKIVLKEKGFKIAAISIAYKRLLRIEGGG